jgi:hypothetical protein
MLMQRLSQDSLSKKTNKDALPVKSESPARVFLRIMGSPFLRGTGIRCIIRIFRNFFLLQYWAAIFPGRYPVFQVDHPLDEKIPFRPRKVGIYLDFVAFWIRTAGFLLNRFGRRAFPVVKEFLDSMGRLYEYAAEVYRTGFSTTNRPHYLGTPRFALIHAFDPHLMCIPSLHVMVVIRTYTLFRDMLRRLGAAEIYAPQIEEIRRGALDISEAVLYVKQHSVNCISAAMYAMTSFDRPLFPPPEAEAFASELFLTARRPGGEDGDAVRGYMVTLYRRFIDESINAPDWKTPLINFLYSLPKIK